MLQCFISPLCQLSELILYQRTELNKCSVSNQVYHRTGVVNIHTISLLLTSKNVAGTTPWLVWVFFFLEMGFMSQRRRMKLITVDQNEFEASCCASRRRAELKHYLYAGGERIRALICSPDDKRDFA